MAIVQISRIQHRRGRVLEGTGMPQLASGELGWAIDTQELYIGSGSVSEGSPAVGNIKLLTEHDTLIDFALQGYSYKAGDIQTGDLQSSEPFTRTIQQRLDERVTIAAFGASGVSDGSTDDAIVIQRALDQLYLINNVDVSSRVEIHFPAGEYLIKSTIYVPPYATIIGAGKGKTILHSDNVTVFKTVSGLSTPRIDNTPGIYVNATDNFDQPKNITITGLTIKSFSKEPAIIVSSCSDSLFQDISIEGNWDSITDISNTSPNWIGIKLDGVSTNVTSNNNRFINIDVSGFIYAIGSDYDVYYNTFTNNTFKNCRYGVVFGKYSMIGSVGYSTGPSYNTIQTCIFDSIYQHAIWVEFGQYNASTNNKFLAVGNDGGTDSTAIASVIKFTALKNVSEGDFFKRSMELVSESGLPKPYPPEVEGNVTFSNLYKNFITIGPTPGDVFKDLIKLPSIKSGKITIDYIYTVNDIVREGAIDIVCRAARTLDSVAAEHFINDSYTSIGTGDSSLLEFDVRTEPRNSIDTLILQVKNKILNLTNDKFMYTINIKS